MKPNIISIGAIAAAALSVPGLAHAQRVIQPEVAWKQAVAKDLLYQTELRQEANANYLSPTQLQRVRVAQAILRARAEKEAAAYERFRFDQQLALQEAQSAKTYIINNAGSSSSEEEVQPSTNRGVQMPTGYRSTSPAPATYEGMAPQGGVRTYVVTPVSPTVERLLKYPDRFWAKQTRERGVDQQNKDILAREAIEATAAAGFNSGALRATPGSDRTGYVTNPETGNVIDVRGFRSGDMARDPYSGETFRVP